MPTVNLVSMPWANPLKPSIQIASLKAYVDREFNGKIKIHSHVGHWIIPVEVKYERFQSFFTDHEVIGEELYNIIFSQTFPDKVDQKGNFSKISTNKLVKLLNETKLCSKTVSANVITRLRKATNRFIRDKIVPCLDAKKTNVVGFTLHHSQTFASLYVATFLSKMYPNYSFLFLFGGGSTIYPETIGALRKSKIQCFAMKGEGELCLESIIRHCPDKGSIEFTQLTENIYRSLPFLVPINLPHLDENLSRESKGKIQQILSLKSLPLPDYDDYFKDLRCEVIGDELFLEIKDQVEIQFEGSRGCFVKCNFCALNAIWSGFRKMDGDEIFSRVTELIRRHSVTSIRFVDNVCDTWAERYADLVFEHGIRISSFMELRAHHPEIFWTKLKLAGVSEVQVGIESLSGGLLSRMRKQTSLIQNVRVLKYLSELQIVNRSNLMLNHPLSQLDDILEFKRIISYIPHFIPLQCCDFELVPDSPFFEQLSERERKSLIKNDWFNPNWREFTIRHSYHPPQSLKLQKKVEQGWVDFRKWYEKFLKTENICLRSLTVSSVGKELALVKDKRNFKHMEYLISGLEARVLHECHQGCTKDQLSKQCNASIPELSKAIASLSALKLLLPVSDRFLSLPNRSTEELYSNCLKNKQPVQMVLGSEPSYQESHAVA